MRFPISNLTAGFLATAFFMPGLLALPISRESEKAVILRRAPINMAQDWLGPGSYYIHDHVHELCPEIPEALERSFDVANDAVQLIDLLLDPALKGDPRLDAARSIAENFFYHPHAIAKVDPEAQLHEVQGGFCLISSVVEEITNELYEI